MRVFKKGEGAIPANARAPAGTSLNGGVSACLEGGRLAIEAAGRRLAEAGGYAPMSGLPV